MHHWFHSSHLLIGLGVCHFYLFKLSQQRNNEFMLISISQVFCCLPILRDKEKREKEIWESLSKKIITPNIFERKRLLFQNKAIHTVLTNQLLYNTADNKTAPVRLPQQKRSATGRSSTDYFGFTVCRHSILSWKMEISSCIVLCDVCSLLKLIF